MKFKDIDLSKIGTDKVLIGGVWANADGGYIMYLPEYGTPHDVTLHGIDATTEEWKVFLRQSDLMETEVLSKCEDGKLYKTIVRKCQRNIDQQVSWNVFKRDRYACRYCGQDSVPLTVDHLVLWENGGPSTEVNLVSSCRKCNKTRGRMEYADWIVYRYYLKVAKNLSVEQRKANTDLVSTLPGIEPVINVRKKR